MTIPTFPSEATFPATAESTVTFPAAEVAPGGYLLLETGASLQLETGAVILLEA